MNDPTKAKKGSSMDDAYGNRAEDYVESNMEMSHSDNDMDDDDLADMQMDIPSHSALMMMGGSSDDGDDNDDDDQFGDHNNVPLPKSIKKKRHSLSMNLGAGWDDSAIIRCFDLALQTHDSKDVNKGCFHPLSINHSNIVEEIQNDGGGCVNVNVNVKPQESSDLDLDPPPRWRPGDLPLPQWAVDPWYAIRNGVYSNSNVLKVNNNGTNEQSGGNERSTCKKRLPEPMEK